MTNFEILVRDKRWRRELFIYILRICLPFFGVPCAAFILFGWAVYAKLAHQELPSVGWLLIEFITTSIVSGIIIGLWSVWKNEATFGVRSVEEQAEYVYVNEDGSARELSQSEKAYLTQQFDPFDSNRPHIKSSYRSKNGWGKISGFMAKRNLPAGIRIYPIDPLYDDTRAKESFNFTQMMIEASRRAGDDVTQNPDGTYASVPNPNVSAKERAKIVQDLMDEEQSKREQQAKFKSGSG